TIFVADVLAADGSPGRIAIYDADSGKFKGELVPSPTVFAEQFNPRGVVFGPDGNLYVSVFNTTNPRAGAVLRYGPATGAWSVVATNNGDGIADPGENQSLHRPEGIVFGPDGNIYVTSYRADATDNDKILVLNPATGAQIDEIDTDAVGGPRAYGQGLLFGPGGGLFVPITTIGVPDSGTVRRYDVSTKTYDVFVDHGPLVQPWYLTFGRTDPATLDYIEPAVHGSLSVTSASGSSAATSMGVSLSTDWNTPAPT